MLVGLQLLRVSEETDRRRERVILKGNLLWNGMLLKRIQNAIFLLFRFRWIFHWKHRRLRLLTIIQSNSDIVNPLPLPLYGATLTWCPQKSTWTDFPSYFSTRNILHNATLSDRDAVDAAKTTDTTYATSSTILENNLRNACAVCFEVSGWINPVSNDVQKFPFKC
jgi:hypothetical protein